MFHRLPLALALLAVAATAAFAVAQGRSQGTPSPVDRLFENDANGDGKLSKDELPGRFADRIFEQADADQDGFIDRTELAAFFEERGFRGTPDGARGASPEREPNRDLAQFDRQMGTLGRTMRRLSRSDFDAETYKADLAAVDAVQKALVEAKALVGVVRPTLHGLETHGGDVDAYRKAFRRQLVVALAKSVELEHAVLDGDGERAMGLVKQMVEIRDAGHAVFKPEDEDTPRRGGRGG